MRNEKYTTNELNAELKNESISRKRDLGLYIHIPFCIKKCSYCDFLSGTASQDEIRAYFDALLTEIEQYHGATEHYIVPTIFIGGGTPSVVDASYIERIMEKVTQIFQIDQERLEATIEINPGTVTREKLEAYRRAGINRISFGLQSTNNEELKLLGRIHTFEQFEQNYNLARELGFHNINIDLMSALPRQTLQSWEETLNKVIQLKPEHISAYSLIIEEGTEFYDRYREGAKEANLIPDEETDRLMYYRTKEMLQNFGYERYEISNYSKPGFACMHNQSYWVGTEYLGIGLGASSLLDGARFSNMHHREQYIEHVNRYNRNYMDCKMERVGIDHISDNLVDYIGIRCDYKKLTKKEQMEEFMFLGLRICQGISKSAFLLRFGVPIEEIYGHTLQSLIEKNLVLEDGDKLKLSEYGVDISNHILADFLID